MPITPSTDPQSDVPAGAGRYAPTPSGELHLGNLRTAILAWLFARSTGRAFHLRVEDLDQARSRREAGDQQVEQLAELGLDWDGEVVWQSAHLDRYHRTIEDLRRVGLTYECFCNRREIQEAASAPHAAPGSYPGTCRDLSEAEREERRRDRSPALRLRAEATSWTVQDRLHGEYTGVVDDFVLLRNDGTPAYNLAVVVDDAAQGVDQVVRGDDLLPSTPRQAYLASLLGLELFEYAHVPLVLNPEGKRLAKRDGAVTLSALARAGVGVDQVRGLLLASLRLPTGSLADALEDFDPDALPTGPWVLDPAELAHHSRLPDRKTRRVAGDTP